MLVPQLFVEQLLLFLLQLLVVQVPEFSLQELSLHMVTAAPPLIASREDAGSRLSSRMAVKDNFITKMN